MVLATNDTDAPKEEKSLKKAPICPKCQTELGYRVRRGFLYRKVLTWLPVKRYYCY